MGGYCYLQNVNNSQQMEAAVMAVESGSAFSINRAARDHGIPPKHPERSTVGPSGGWN